MDDLGLQTPLPPQPPIPPIIPSAPEPIAPPPPPAIQPETPKVSAPKKKFPIKPMAGILMAVLLIGGALILSRQLVEQRQTAEQQAANSCTGLTEEVCKDTDGCSWSGYNGACEEASGQKCPSGVKPTCSDPPEHFCVTCPISQPAALLQCLSPYWPSRPTTGGPGSCPQGQIEMLRCTCGGVPASPSPVVSPSPVPSPSPSAGPELKCVDLRKNAPTPQLGDTVTFTCEGNYTQITGPKGYFRHSTDDGQTFSAPQPTAGRPMNENKRASYNITIDKPGNWEVQCRICGQVLTQSWCTVWGKANVNPGGLD